MKQPATPRTCVHWYVMDEKFFLYTMVLAWREGRDPKIHKSHCERLRIDPIQTLKKYIKSIPQRKKWGIKIKNHDVDEIREYAMELLKELISKKRMDI